MNAKAIQSYCGKFDGSTGNSIADSNPEQSHNDLLEFEF
jgi:hypothetical protein